MAAKKKKREMFLVVGVATTGSGSLTWPEDFDLDGVYEDEAQAIARSRVLNAKLRKAVIKDLDLEREDDETEEEFEERVDDYMDESEGDELLYRVEPVSHFAKR